MTRLNSSCVSVQRNRSICQSAASPEAVLPSASILPPPTREGASAGVAYSRSDEGRSNDNVTPQTLNAVNSFVASGKTKKIASNSSRSSDSNLYQPRAAVQKNQAPATNTRSSCGAAAPRKGRSRRASTAAHATASNESNLHNSNLFICNLDTRVSQAELETAFAEHGTILSSAVMRDIHTGESLGTAFVRMSSHDEARCTMEAMNGVHVGSRSISVQWARRSEGGPVGEARKKIMKLFVRNIPLDCTKMDLEELFGAYGSVRQVTLHKDTSPVQDEAMVRLIAFLAEDLAKHYREHNHQQQQQQGDSTPTAAATKQRHRRSHSQRNSLTLIESKSPSHKQTISSGNAVMGLSSHTSSTTLSIHAGQSGGADASIVDMGVPSDVSFCTNYPQLTPPQCNVPPVKTPLGSMTPATLLQQHRMSCVRGAAASSAAPLSPSNALQFLATAPSNAGGRMPAVSTPTCKGAATVPFVAGSQRPSFIDIPNSQVAQSFFFNMTPRLYHLPTAHAVPERQDSRAAVVLPNPRCEALPVQGRSMDDSQPIVAYSGPGEESDLRIVDTAPVAHPVLLRPQPNVKTAPPKLPQTYRHNPYISCSFIRVG
ncbi:RNA recognition motif family protein [Leishmania donovani]|uniref:RNA recognition motif family protein n=1 Tax=Leishmania donovani TaxID=5661 RepID=A0A504XVY0_LEIDO|nr:RNA recognition motif family protein [Leishmania donovani]